MPKTAATVCKHCGLEESEHHTFESLVDTRQFPDGCVCDKDSWYSITIRPICGAFNGQETDNCADCEHNFECHSAAPKETA